ncbi:DUF1501 domain-containing protein [Urbifossiella limnaea]|uniref:DUF1501 domain-containing protein n=1 Tax=Urbifossiella limnaea TaxID=2528023 RepID=A0A517XND7_9BACT|nr:DUF1501 domain-containing protein [Urbifossiella limnaea]QDU19024.1 hypothetical protein ETAA1_09260 [Urbifossiella limnaea]
MPLPDWFARRAGAGVSRRSALKLGAASVLGLSLPECLAAAGAGAKPAAKNVLVLYEQGGLSHMDTWDPKPEAFVDHRSPFRPIATRVPGVRFTDLLPHTADVADKLAVVRGMHHSRGGADAHPNGTQYALSGAHPAASPLTMPDIGSVVSHVIGSECKYLPPYVMVPGNHEQAAEARTGFLPAGTKVFKTGGRNLADPAWKLDGLVPVRENQSDRLGGRHGLRDALDRQPLGSGASLTDVQGMDRFYDQAFDMLTSPKVSDAFDLKKEPPRVRDAYGPGHRGACYLVGRKLIEAGVRFVTVDTRWPQLADTPRGGNLNWDHHDHIYATGTCELPGATGAGAGRYGIGHWVMMGSVDRAFAALVRDLDQRGLLAETLVCFVSEFGRTPKINKARGRDHWTHAYSIVFAGAGVRGGQVIGRTDRDGGYVVDAAYTPEDYASTIYEKLGIDRAKPVYTASNRPVYFGHLGAPIPGIV